MNTKPKVIAIILVAVLVTTPFLASASSSSQSLDLFASIAAVFQGYLGSIYGVLSKILTNAPMPASTLTSPKFVSNSITLQLGDKSVMVAMLQRALIQEGYLKSPVTGVFDANTKAAVEAFQKAKNLTVTGYIEIATSSITSTFAGGASSFVPIQAGATGTEASDLQSFLIKKGDLHISAPTNFFGALTEAGVKAFQKSHDLPQTGVIDQATFAAMNGK